VNPIQTTVREAMPLAWTPTNRDDKPEEWEHRSFVLCGSAFAFNQRFMSDSIGEWMSIGNDGDLAKSWSNRETSQILIFAEGDVILMTYSTYDAFIDGIVENQRFYDSVNS